MDQRLSGLGRIAAAQPEHLDEGDLAADLSWHLLDADNIAFGHAVLLPAGPDDCVHRANPCRERAERIASKPSEVKAMAGFRGVGVPELSPPAWPSAPR